MFQIKNGYCLPLNPIKIDKTFVQREKIRLKKYLVHMGNNDADTCIPSMYQFIEYATSKFKDIIINTRSVKKPNQTYTCHYCKSLCTSYTFCLECRGICCIPCGNSNKHWQTCIDSNELTIYRADKMDYYYVAEQYRKIVKCEHCKQCIYTLLCLTDKCDKFYCPDCANEIKNNNSFEIYTSQCVCCGDCNCNLFFNIGFSLYEWVPISEWNNEIIFVNSCRTSALFGQYMHSYIHENIIYIERYSKTMQFDLDFAIIVASMD